MEHGTSWSRGSKEVSFSTVLSFLLSLLQTNKSVRLRTAIVPSPLGRSLEDAEEAAHFGGGRRDVPLTEEVPLLFAFLLLVFRRTGSILSRRLRDHFFRSRSSRSSSSPSPSSSQRSRTRTRDALEMRVYVNDYEANGRESKIWRGYDVVSSVCVVSRRLRAIYIDCATRTRNLRGIVKFLGTRV